MKNTLFLYFDFPRLTFAVVLLLMIPCFPVSAGEQAARSANQNYDVIVDYVTVPFHAVDRSGRPVTDLTEADFEVFEDGSRQAIRCFERPEIPRSRETPGITDQAHAPVRDLALFLDFYNISSSEWNSVRPELQRFLAQLPGAWSVMVATYSPDQELVVSGPYGGDSANLVSLLENVSINRGRDERLRKQMREFNRILDDALERGAGERQSIFAESPGSVFGELYIQHAIACAQRFEMEQRGWSDSSIEALKNFAAYLKKNFPHSERTIVYISGGFNILPGRMFYDKLERVLHVSWAGDRGRDLFTDEGLSLPAKKIYEGIKDTIDNFIRSNVMVYSINTLGPMTGSIDAGAVHTQVAWDEPDIWKDFQDGMARIANETGGSVFQNSTDFSRGFGTVLQDVSNSYLLCYQKPDRKGKKDFHKITLKSKRHGIKLSYRRGYAE